MLFPWLFFVFYACDMKADIIFSFWFSVNKQKSHFQKVLVEQVKSWGRRAPWFSAAEPRCVPGVKLEPSRGSQGNTDSLKLKYNSSVWICCPVLSPWLYITTGDTGHSVWEIEPKTRCWRQSVPSLCLFLMTVVPSSGPSSRCAAISMAIFWT